MDVVEIARILNREKTIAAPLRRISVVSIYDGDFYENYDIDVIGPRTRFEIARALLEAGFRQASGNSFTHHEQPTRLAFAKLGVLGSDPLKPALDVVRDPATIGLLTPTQSLLLYLDRFSVPLEEDCVREIVDLVWEQPANLDKVQQWTRRTPRARAYRSIQARVAESQARGIELRRRREFASELPR